MHSALCLIYTLTHEVCNLKINTKTPEITLSQSLHCLVVIVNYMLDEVGLLISLSQVHFINQFLTPT